MRRGGFRWRIYSTINPNSEKGYGRNQTTAETVTLELAQIPGL
jgi:hypothetical protein